MAKLTAPAPQHPLRRWKFFKENKLPQSEWECKKIEQKYPKMFLGKPKEKAVEKPVEAVKEVNKPTVWQKIKRILWQKIKRIFSDRRRKKETT